MKKILAIALFSLSLFFLSGAAANAQTVSGSIGTVARGGSVKGTITLSIPGGLHVNSSRPNSQYAIPTSVRVSATGAKAGAVTYPRGKNRKFQFSEDTLNVYEGTVSFPFSLTVPANFKGDAVRVRAVVRYQACTDEVCYPPKSKEVTLTARVR
ncbi:MAG TPA: protein-disulfide reductase DsbD domain-containing protein [Pyrinomonadaceae bacterium]|jgi:DsbC/DsbD-like thiol-disulfide interchange protein